MEEWVGERWHRLITRAADASHTDAAVTLEQVTRSVQLLFRAGGGDALVRVVPATARRIGGPRGWLQRLAGSGVRGTVSALDAETLALPPVLATFTERALNRDLYLWLAALGACHTNTSAGWIADNLAATERALQTFPGLRTRHARLLAAHLAQRPPLARLRGPARAAEQAVQAALQGQVPAGDAAGRLQPTDAAHVWLWLQAHEASPSGEAITPDMLAAPPVDRPRDPNAKTQEDTKRRRAERTEDTSNKNGLVMFFRAESILSWSEFVRVNRTDDDEDQQNASQVADDMEQLSIAQRGETLAARVKFDLDLPSASADDLPVGEGEPLPEWDFKQQRLVPDRCRAQRMRHRPPEQSAIEQGAVSALPEAMTRLKSTSRQVRRRFEALRAAPRWQHGLTQGDELDLDAWVRHQVQRRDTRQPHGESPAVYSRRVKSERSLSTLMLADLSLSTDAYATQEARVIDLVRDSLLVFGDALDAAGDPFEMLGFSSVRRAIRMLELKRFGEAWNDATRERVLGIRPGFYTRMGAAIRYGTQRLAERGERQRLLLILSDGKPNDLDHYEGRHGLEDTRHAVHAARQAGLTPFCVTIDREANAYLPRLFGAQGYALVHRADQLPGALTQVYLRLTIAAR
ncbi:VWA domain-containing protein [Ottowia sp. GY511]|uniref:Nitric oxide reductase activation protein NorD n=1 Tax=Ottowia flava TaxID=2675430 RepID=A0ABW4KPF2_9BURK|nr:VWA domain-containing protein [Ottowia sp. GY511]TXK29699.1 VWA domain-containing protein [Ottowia sp. GY511]